MKKFVCPCGSPLSFDSVRCLRCNSIIGYDPGESKMVRLDADVGFKRCENGILHDVCNWLLPSHSPQRLCTSCRMNRLVPDLRYESNRVLWRRMELAKRRLIYSLSKIGLTLLVDSQKPEAALTFDIVSTKLDPSVTTGHLNGVITVNLDEADDTYRQINRQQLGENSRTLVGHFRHESAHYLWGRFLSPLEWDHPHRVAFRERFGEEWLDYGAALQSYYSNGVPVGWQQNSISAYATSHPWEDWAETWGHYLLIIDALETCDALGIQAQSLAVPMGVFNTEAGLLPAVLSQQGHHNDAFLAMLQRWKCVATVLNEISASVGEPPLYPFSISPHVAQKLRLAHFFAQEWGSSRNR